MSSRHVLLFALPDKACLSGTALSETAPRDSRDPVGPGLSDSVRRLLTVWEEFWHLTGGFLALAAFIRGVLGPSQAVAAPRRTHSL